MFWSLNLREFSLLVQNFEDKQHRENANAWFNAIAIIDNLGGMFSKNHHPLKFDEWFPGSKSNQTQPTGPHELTIEEKRQKLEAMEWALEFGIAAAGIDELRAEIEAYDGRTRTDSETGIG